MTIGWDPLLCAACATELNALLSGDRIRALSMDGERRVLALFLDERTLVVELSRGWIGLLASMERPETAHSLRHRIREITSPPDESILRIRLTPLKGRAEPLAIVVELIGTRRNAMAIEERAGVIRHVVSPRDSGRILKVGATYAAPRPTGRAGPQQLADRSDWERELATVDDPETPLRRRVLERVAFASSLNVDWILGGDPWKRWNALVEPANWGGYLIEGRHGPQPYPVPLSDTIHAVPSEPPSEGTIGLPAGPFPDLLAALAAARRTSDAAPPLAAVVSPEGAFSRGVQALARARKRLRALERELAGAPDPEALRRTGDLLLARLHEVPRGTERVSLTDFEGNPAEIRLDPAVTPAENADAYYHKAGRAERANRALPDRIERAAAEVDRIEGLLSAYETGEASDARLSEALGPSTARRTVRSRAKGEPGTVPYRSYRSSGGLEIRVGRGARHNDDLTFHYSAPDDIWLHALQTSGAHVVLRWGKKERPPRRDLTEAAILAALHSGGRHSGSVAVGWTRRKYVRKPRGAPPGAVAPDRTETVFVTPDESIAEALTPEPGAP